MDQDARHISGHARPTFSSGIRMCKLWYALLGAIPRLLFARAPVVQHISGQVRSSLGPLYYFCGRPRLLFAFPPGGPVYSATLPIYFFCSEIRMCNLGSALRRTKSRLLFDRAPGSPIYIRAGHIYVITGSAGVIWVHFTLRQDSFTFRQGARRSDLFPRRSDLLCF